MVCVVSPPDSASLCRVAGGALMEKNLSPNPTPHNLPGRLVKAEELKAGELGAGVVHDWHELPGILCGTVTIVPIRYLPEDEPLGLLENIQRDFTRALGGRDECERLGASFTIKQVDGTLQAHVVSNRGYLVRVNAPPSGLVHLDQSGAKLSSLLLFGAKQIPLCSIVGHIKRRGKNYVPLVCLFVLPRIPGVRADEPEGF